MKGCEVDKIVHSEGNILWAERDDLDFTRQYYG